MEYLELLAQANNSGYVLLRAPIPGYQYVIAKTYSDTRFKDDDGKVKSIYQKEKKHFAKFYAEMWEELGMRKILSPNEVYCLTLLFPFCEINTNILISKDDGIPLDLNAVAKIINREERQTRRIMKSLIDKNLIARIESGGCFKHCVNPELYWNGGDIIKYNYFRTMFYTYKDDKVKEAEKQLKILNVNGKKTSILY